MTGSVASDGQTPMTGSLNLSNNKAINVTDPTNAQDAATKNYVDSALTTATALYLAKASNLSDVANATTARGNLTAAKSGANSDITSITGLTTPLTVAQGGIGTATLTANNVLLGNGTSAPQVVAPSTSGNVLTSNGTTWSSAANTGAAKAWVRYNSSAQTVTSSFNVSSVTYNGTGNFTVNLTTALANANYAVIGQSNSDAATNRVFYLGNSITTTSFEMLYQQTNTSSGNPTIVCAAAFS
jgi:hypothetical protein